MMGRRIVPGNGFTLIELILAIGFVSILLLAVSVLTIRVGDMYEKGATVRSINQVSREVMDILRRDFAQANNTVRFTSDNGTHEPIYRLCLGEVSYLANSAKLLSELEANEGGSTVPVVTKQTTVNQALRLVRVVDKGGALCEAVPGGGMPMQVDSAATELLTSATMPLAVHAMNVTRVANGAEQALYRVSLLVGTNEKGTVDENNRCRVASGGAENTEANFNYCSVAEVTTVMRTGGSE